MLATEGRAAVACCQMPDCFRRAVRNGFCEAHRKRKWRGSRLSPPVREQLSAYERTLAAGVEHLDSIDKKRIQRSQKKTLKELHAEAVEAFRLHLAADTDSDYHRTRVRFRAAARMWILNLRDCSLRELTAELQRISSEIQQRGKVPCSRCGRCLRERG